MGDQSSTRGGAWASYACAVLTVLALGVGITLATRIGVASGVDVARADLAALRSIQPLLLAAEVLKIGAALATAVAVAAAGRRFASPAPTYVLGYLGALLLLGAGVLGISAVVQIDDPAGSPAVGRIVALLGLLSAALTGLWAAALGWRWSRSSDFPRWLRWTALLLALFGLAALALPPVGLLFGITSLFWWIGLGRLVGRSA